ncbi:MAG: site-specific DNA-methyltransferase, partial [Anaerolineae bacterium]|nr:site-specific DNA-methyltransferase [Anaerolineae bacterium]
MTGNSTRRVEVDQWLKERIPADIDLSEPKTAIPGLAKKPETVARLREILSQMPTRHRLVHGDARDMARVPDNSVHLIVTSPPYWILKEYPDTPGQLGQIESYDAFLDEMDKVWRECYRMLVEGGRLIIVVGDVCLSRRQYGRHLVMPLHASFQERCRLLGFDNLAPIIWYKIANITLEVENGSRFLGKPYEPGGIVKNDVEYILMQRKPGAYRKPSLEMRVFSVIAKEEHGEWFRQIWDMPGASTRQHPAPFPLDLAERLIRMFSFVGDTVVDPFMGTGTTNLAAAV